MPRAAPLPTAASPTAVSRFVLGAGWGCAMVMSKRGPHWHCFRGSSPSTQIPWMEGRTQFFAGPDRLREVDDSWMIEEIGLGPLIPITRCLRPPRTFKNPKNVFKADIKTAYKSSGERLIDWPEVKAGNRGCDAPWQDPENAFTCRAGVNGLGVFCSGTTREGLFGSPSDCPTKRGAPFVAHPPQTYPRTGCSTSATPAPVKATEGLTADKLEPSPMQGATTGFDYAFGPRGVCVVSKGVVSCVGAVATPRVTTRMSHVRVSPGQDASACAIGADSRLYCWGEAYASPKDPSLPIAVIIRPAPPNSDDAAIDRRPGEEYNCSIHYPCYAKRKIRACPDSQALRGAAAWSDLLPQAERLAGSQVSVRGILKTALPFNTMEGCSGPYNDCCYPERAYMAIDRTLILPNLSCKGDESRLCCELEVGKTVIATGWLTTDLSGDAAWRLESAQLCLASQ